MASLPIVLAFLASGTLGYLARTATDPLLVLGLVVLGPFAAFAAGMLEQQRRWPR
jgi:pilus assembly protein TadC